MPLFSPAGVNSLQALIQAFSSTLCLRNARGASACSAGETKRGEADSCSVLENAAISLLSGSSARKSRRNKLLICLSEGRSVLIDPKSSSIVVQCRGFRTQSTSTKGFNKLNSDSKKPLKLYDYIVHYLIGRKLAPELRAREELNNYSAYKSEMERLSNVEQKPFTDGFVRGVLLKSAEIKPLSPSKFITTIRVLSWIAVITAVLYYFSGLKIKRGSSKFSTILSSSPNEIIAENVGVTFADVRGMEEAKHELEEIVNYLCDPDRYSRLGGRLPKGVLLSGPPGTGKTLLARAVAGQANVPFFHAAGSEFDEVLVGQGARRVRDLFEKAKEQQPCIIFIDEIDSVGSKRISNGVHPFANQTINQLLSEMDGFERNESVIVIGATNRAEALDKALLRPGRFDVRVTISKPDLADRIEIFKFYLKKIVHERAINVTNLAKGTSGFTGADIENMINQAALKATTEGCKRVETKHLEDAKDRILMGPARMKGRYADEEINRVTAYHEAGHTLIALLTNNTVPLHKVTIIPRGDSLGHTSLIPEKDEQQVTRAQMLAHLDMLMGGRAAEELIFGDERVTTGPGNDLKKATELAISMVKEYGMSDKVGLRDFTVLDDDNSMHEVSNETRGEIDAEVNRLLKESHRRALNILTKHSKEHQLLAEALLEFETLSADEVRKVVKGEDISKLKKQQLELKASEDDKSPERKNPKKPPRELAIQKIAKEFVDKYKKSGNN